MCVEVKTDSLDDMCDDNYLDSKQDDIEVKIKHFIKSIKEKKMNKISIMLATILVVLFVCTFSLSVISFLIWVGVGLLNLFGLNIKFSFEFCFIVWATLSIVRFVNSICKR